MSFPLILQSRGVRRAFTLIELLTVIAIIGILAAITFGAARGVFQQSRINRSKAELGSLGSALEEYKKYYGDYPGIRATETAPDQIDPKDLPFLSTGGPKQTDRAYNFFRALCGRFGPDQSINERRVSKTILKKKYGKSFISPALFSLERSDKDNDKPVGELAIPTPDVSVAKDDPDFSNALLDPWGHRYLYYYKDLGSAGTWKNTTYVLYSAGPDGLATFPSTAGAMPDPADLKNADNIYPQP
ncbi:hypothetical protein IMCC26134_00750 [Verrucomicrobia bacterium IMCC26134]|nr:hypothetical protein IMCC26134_00750 [Verrucomicrobia bacterium IMCC26134]